MGHTKRKRPTHPPVTRVDASNITPPPERRPPQKPPPQEAVIDFWPSKWARQEDFWRGIAANLITAYVATAFALELANIARLIHTNTFTPGTIWPTLILVSIVFALFASHWRKNYIQKRVLKGTARIRLWTRWSAYDEFSHRWIRRLVILGIFTYTNITIIYKIEELLATYSAAGTP